MKIVAQVQSRQDTHEVLVQTDGKTRTLAIPPKSTGFGSSVNGGELLFLALATCYCNDVYREGSSRGIQVTGVEVSVEGDFGEAGEPARDVTYRAKVFARAEQKDIEDLMIHTDRVAEIQNTLRAGVPVLLSGIEAHKA